MDFFHQSPNPKFAEKVSRETYLFCFLHQKFECLVVTEWISSIKITLENFTHVDKKRFGSFFWFRDQNFDSSKTRDFAFFLTSWDCLVIGHLFHNSYWFESFDQRSNGKFETHLWELGKPIFFSPGILIVRKIQRFRVQWLISIFKLKFPSSYRFAHHHQALNRQLLDFCEVKLLKHQSVSTL